MKKLNKLCGRIKEICGTQENCAKNIGLSTHTLSKKLNGRTKFNTDEIRRMCDILSIPETEVHLYFF